MRQHSAVRPAINKPDLHWPVNAAAGSVSLGAEEYCSKHVAADRDMQGTVLLISRQKFERLYSKTYPISEYVSFGSSAEVSCCTMEWKLKQAAGNG